VSTFSSTFLDVKLTDAVIFTELECILENFDNSLGDPCLFRPGFRATGNSAHVSYVIKGVRV